MVQTSSRFSAIVFDLVADFVVVGLVADAGLGAGQLDQLVLHMSELLLALEEGEVPPAGRRDT